MKEEVFGPVTCVVPFKTEEEVYYVQVMYVCSFRYYSRYTVHCVYTFTIMTLLFSSLQVIGRANDVEYGLCASVWSENSGVTHRVAQAIDVSSQRSSDRGFKSHPRQLQCFFSCRLCLLLTYCLYSLALYSHAFKCTHEAAHFSSEK